MPLSGATGTKWYCEPPPLAESVQTPRSGLSINPHLKWGSLTLPLLMIGETTMIYCFDKEDINIDTTYNVFLIQKNYASRISKVCILESEEGESIDVAGENVFLRVSYDHMFSDIEILERMGARLLETKADIEAIENWTDLNLTKRKIETTTRGDLSDTLRNFPDEEKFFIKTKHKGINMVASRESLADRNSNEFRTLAEACSKYGNELLVSEYSGIKCDSIGKRESRHFFINGEIVSSSRYVYGVRHKVPTSHIIKAKEIAEAMKEKTFPSNFVLDIGDFIDENVDTYIDIVEFNPITCSECYVNNSIFYERIQEIDKVYELYRIGNEFCYDLLENPDKYSMERASNRNYQYT